MCHYPECRADPSKTWALLQLCTKHHDLIRAETIKFYKRKVTAEADARPNYYKVDLLVPWSKRNLKIKRGETE